MKQFTILFKVSPVEMPHNFLYELSPKDNQDLCQLHHINPEPSMQL